MTTHLPTIERSAGAKNGRSPMTAYGSLVFAVATGRGGGESMAEQARHTFGKIDGSLEEAGTDRRGLLSVTVYVADQSMKAEMDAEWLAWVGDDPAHWPQRACIAVGLAPGTLIEVVVTAARAA